MISTGTSCLQGAQVSLQMSNLPINAVMVASSNELHLGEISLECSRAGASAVALWATMQLMPLEAGGELGDADRALDHFENALKAGFAHKEWLENDTDLDPIRDTDRFRELVGTLG